MKEIRVAATAVKLETREDGDEKIAGTASVFYNGSEETEYKLWSRTVEHIMPGAFTRAIAEGDDCVALFNHEPDNVLGRTPKTLRLKETKVGLEYEIDADDTTIANDVKRFIKRGDVRGSSFGFEVLEETWRHDDERDLDVREISEAKLYDVSPVTYPAYTGTDAQLRHQEVRSSYDKWKANHDETVKCRERMKELDK